MLQSSSGNMKRFIVGLITGTCFVLLSMYLTGIVKVETYRQGGQLVRVGIGNVHYINPDLIKDGPYVFLDGDSVAYVQALCSGQLYKQVFTLKDTSQFFTNPCDSNISYPIISEFSIEPAIYSGVNKIFAVSDVEGHYNALVSLLQSNGVIDDGLHWQWGDGHLVFNGDMVDRGDKVTETLWLIYRLEQEAKQNGGRVHYVLGNHESMILIGQTQYTHRKYGLVTNKLGMSYQNLYSSDTMLGRWMRSKNTIVKINGIIFVHGGLSPALIRQDLNIEKINQLVRLALDTRWKVKHHALLNLLYGNMGPLWYRGYLQDASLKEHDINSVLAHYNATAIVVGHTIVNAIQPLFGRRVIAIDVTFKDPSKVEALIWENNQFFRAGSNGCREAL
jgi:hypothetical protein